MAATLPIFRRTIHSMFKVVPVPVRQDNYAYLIINQKSSKAAVVDPFDVPKVFAAASSLAVDIVACLTTHHHFDHSGGNEALKKEIPDIPIYGGSKQGQAVNHLVSDKDEFTITQDIHIKCLATPCHTQDSICYYVTSLSDPSQPGVVFTGDTLFIAGCGRFFEGDGTQMHTALSYIGSLPDSTVVYNGHEYTKGNLAFAKSVDGANPALTRLAKVVDENSSTTGLTTVADEKEWNPFMRLQTDAIRNATGGSTTAEIMDKLREKKNNYSG